MVTSNKMTLSMMILNAYVDYCSLVHSADCCYAECPSANSSAVTFGVTVILVTRLMHVNGVLD
jgi:hypothetical protein